MKSGSRLKGLLPFERVQIGFVKISIRYSRGEAERGERPCLVSFRPSRGTVSSLLFSFHIFDSFMQPVFLGHTIAFN